MFFNGESQLLNVGYWMMVSRECGLSCRPIETVPLPALDYMQQTGDTVSRPLILRDVNELQRLQRIQQIVLLLRQRDVCVCDYRDLCIFILRAVTI